MNVKLTLRWVSSILVVIGLLLVNQSPALATNPIDGNTHSFVGTVDVGATASDVRVLCTRDLDNDGFSDILYSAGNTLAVIENGSTSLDSWLDADEIGSAQNPITDLTTTDLDRDGWVDVVTVTGGPGYNEVKLWQNSAMPFAASWTVSNTLASTLSFSVTSVVAADLDGDGFADLVTGGSDGGIHLWANPLTTTTPFTDSWGSSFTAASASGGINGVAVADIDRDGKRDIVAVADNTVQVWRNPGTPFTTSWTVSNTLGTLSNQVVSVVLSDLDNDGWIDVAVGDEAGNVILWHNPLTPVQPFTTSWGAEVDVGDGAGKINDLFAADLDNDGDADLISAGGNSVQAWQNDRTPFSGTWSLTTLGSSADTVYALSVADLDRDGDMDVTSGSGSNEDYEIIVWPNTSIHRESPFRMRGHIVGSLNSRFRAVVSADLDGDGDLDLITGGDSHAGYELVIWQNSGTPFETGWSQYNLGDLSTVYCIAVGDLDNDGDIDIVSGQDSLPQLLIWENDGTPFEGSWNSQSIAGVPARVNDVAVGDLDKDGYPDIVISTGVSGQTPSDSFKVMAWQNDGTPFSGAWSFNDVYTVTYSVNAVTLGDLDNDGWLDIVVGTDHAPGMGNAENPIDPSFWPDVYELLAYHNDRTPFLGAWQQTNIGRDPETASLTAGHYHGYWGATVFSTALADLDNDGDLDIISTEHLEADYQIKVWENDGTPFSGELWQATAAGVYAPWMSSSVYGVTTGDINNDGYIDMVTSSAEFYETVVWENDGRPFGSVISDTTWIRHNLGQYTSEGALSVAVGDLDLDGDLDVVHGSGFYYSAGTEHDVVAWLNQSGSANESAASTASGQFLEGSTDDVLSVGLMHKGHSAEHDIELAEWRLLLEESTGDPLTSTEANAIIENLYVYRDADGDHSWDATDTRVLTIETLSLADGIQTLTFADGDPLLGVGPDDSSLTFFLVVQATSNASSQIPNTLVVTFDPDADSIVEDRVTDTSVSIQDTEPVSTDLTTFVGSPARVIVEDQPTSSGSEVMTATLGTGASLTVYANSHDGSGNFRENVAVTWSLTNTVGNVADTDLLPAYDNRSATFIAHRIGATRILAHDDTLDDDSTDFITVTLEISAWPNPAPVGDTGGAVVTAALVNEDLTPVADGTVVTFTTSLGSFDGQTTVTRTTASSLVTATLTSTEPETATVTVTGNTSEGWIDVTFAPSEPCTVTLEASPTDIVANGTATSTITATVVDQYDNLVTDGTVVTFTTNLGSFPTMPYTRTTTGGVATAILTAGTETGMATVDVTATNATSSTVVHFVPGEPYTVTVRAEPASIVADGVSTATITATVTDQWEHPIVDGTVVTFTTNLGSFPTMPYTRTTTGGVAVAILTSDTDASTATVTVTATHAMGIITATTTVTMTPGALDSLVIRDAPGGGGNQVDTYDMIIGDSLTVYAAGYDVNGNYISDVSVMWDTTDDLDTIPEGPSPNVTFEPITAGTSGTIIADDGHGHTDATGIITVVSGGTPSLTINKSGPVTATTGAHITYVITVTNDGDADAMGLVITDVVPSGAHYVSGGTLDANTVRWAVPSLATATSVQVSFVVTASQTITNSDYRVSAEGDVSAVGQQPVVTIVQTPSKIYLPIVLNKPSIQPVVYAPDLVVKSLTASSNRVQVVIQNVGNAPVTDAFWVDVYFDPSTPPELNQPWDTIASYGTIWGVTVPIQAGDNLALTTDQGDLYYFPESSSLPPLPVGADVYALVDSVNFDTGYGAVQEDDEDNNLFGPITSTPGAAGDTGPSTGQYQSPSTEGLPPR